MVDDQTRPDQTYLVKRVNIQEAKTHLSRLLEEAVAGEEIVIAKAGRPYVKLTPWQPDRAPRKLGGWEGQIWIADDFDETSPDVVRLFEGE
jgi:prevent-host-death family protein